MAHALRGVIAPVPTPFDADGSVATELFTAHAHRVLADGCVGIAPFGTTGEANSVGLSERMSALEALAQSGIAPERMVPGCGVTNIADTALLSRHATDLGCAGAMLLPPFYYKSVPDDGLYDYYARVIDTVGRDGLRIYLYHIPQIAGVGMPVPVARRLREAFPEVVVGLKDSSGSWESNAAFLGIDGLAVYLGSEKPLMEALELGAAGTITVSANLNPGPIAEVIRLFDAGDRDGAARVQERVSAFRTLMEGYPTIPMLKRLLAVATGDARWAAPLPPLPAVPEGEGRDLARRLADEFGILAAA